MDTEMISRRRFLSRLSLGLSALAAAVIRVPNTTGLESAGPGVWPDHL